MKEFVKNNLKTPLKGRRVLALLLAVLMLTAVVAATASCESASPPVTTAGEETTAEPSPTETTGAETGEETEGETHAHAFSDYTVVAAPTCTMTGVEKRVCADCGEAEEREIPMAAHSYLNGICAVCGAKDPSDPLYGLSYQKSVCVLYWADVETPEFDSGMATSNVERAIYKRNMATRDRLGLTEIVFDGCKGNANHTAEFVECLRNDISSGAVKYDAVAGYSRTMAFCAVEGLLADLATVEDSYLDLSQSYWKPAGEELLIGDSLYYLTGEISSNFYMMLYALFCNTDIVTELSLTDPTALVTGKKWTVEAFQKMTEGLYLEQDGDNVPSSGDRYGFVSDQLHIESFLHGAGFRLTERGEEEALCVTRDLSHATLYTLVVSLTELCGSKDAALSGGEEIFVSGNALFAQNRLYFADRKLDRAEFDWTILPLPMYDEKQDGYRTTVGNPFTLYGISKGTDAERRLMGTAFLESMARDSALLIAPAVLAENLPKEMTEREALFLVESLTAIREGVVLDHGRIFPKEKMGMTMIDLFSLSIVKDLDYVEQMKDALPTLKSRLSQILADIKANNA